MLFSKIISFFVFLFIFSTYLTAETLLIQDKMLPGKTFPLVSADTTDIIIDHNDAKVVEIVSGLFSEDICRVTGTKPAVLTALPAKASQVVIIGTIGSSKYIDSMIEQNILETSEINGQWESYMITTVKKPFAGIDQALVIAGSDRRGTAYGVLSISEAIGVSPWYYWADVPTPKKEQIHISTKTVIQKSPSVKYRGIFINDEDWGLHPWSAKNFEKELGDIGPKTYAQVCELLLRLKANMLAPAMHSCTGAFYSFPDNKVVADMYAIIITTSHCEPLLFNNAAKSEWDSKKDGEWNYATNKDRILKKLDDRVSEANRYENIYTMGMRGLHDEGMRGNQSKEEKVKILEKVISDQRNILTKYISDRVEDVPQIFVPYKEALDLYDAGLNVPDDITLVWTDDNYGYIKRLSNSQEQKRAGGSGVYYHYSYLGAPHDYLWLCTTAPVLMYMEMKKAYDTGADKYWLVNVGDIKPAELGMQTFFDFAWNIDKFDIKSINQHQSRFLAEIFGDQYQETFQNVLDNYYRLAWERKPEYMGWEREWDRNKERGNLTDTDYSFENYNNAQQRLADYKLISDIVNNIYNELPEEYKPAFFELLSYPVMGSYQINRKFLMSQLSREHAIESDLAGANWAAQEAIDAHAKIEQMNIQYNTMLDGKWQGMMMLAPGWVSKYQNMPKVVQTQGVDAKPVDISVQKEKNKLDGCTVIDLKNIKNKVATNGHTISMIDGIGYDWYAVQLGKATETKVDPEDLNGTRLEYELPIIDADFATVYVYTVPFFPVSKDRSNQFGISIDSQPVFVAENLPSEYSEPWKDQVLQNGTVAKAKFPINNKTQKHTLIITCGDPGITIQRIIVDWGGLKKSYVGPGIKLLD